MSPDARGGMIDLHCHLLPGIDDGAVDLDESVAMARLAVAEGTTAIVATPHLRHERWWNSGREDLAARLETVRQRLAAEAIPLELHLGGEVALHSESFEELLALPDGDLLPLAGSRYVLLELPWRPLGPDPADVVHELTVRGWVPIVAHPERVPWLMDDVPFMAALRGRGARLQVTGASLAGHLGARPERASSRLLEAGLVDFVSSDGHRPGVRPPGLGDARRTLVARYGEAAARLLLEENPRAVVEDRPLAGESVATA